MSNSPNFEIVEVDFDALLLDLANPRIYAWKPKTQAEAITAMMEARGEQTCKLAKDIADDGQRLLLRHCSRAEVALPP